MKTIRIEICFRAAVASSDGVKLATDMKVWVCVNIVTLGRFYNNRGMSSLLGNVSVNILPATNTDNNSEYIVITRC
jgi:hypothetical protein